MRRCLIALLAAGVVPFTTSCSCTKAGCGPEATISGERRAATGGASAAYDVHVCYEGDCGDTEVRAGRTAGIHLRGGSFEAYVAEGGPGVVMIRVFGWLGAPDDGDSYVVEVRDAASRDLLASVDERATYETSYPNGESCGPSCMHTEIDL